MALAFRPPARFGWGSLLERKAARPRDVSMSVVDLTKSPDWPDDNPERLARDHFGRVDIVYACVQEIYTSAAEARLHPATIKIGTDPEEILQGPLADLLRQPNPAESQFEFLEYVHLYLQVAGNCYLFKQRGATGRTVELYHIRPDKMRVVPGSRTKPQGYVYVTDQAGELPVAADDIIHLKRPNPWNDVYGLAPLHVLNRNTGLHVSLLGFQKATFDNGGVPGGILKLKRQIVDDDEPERLRNAWRTRFGQGAGGGFENWGRLAVLDSDAEFQAVQMDLDKMALPDLMGGNELAFCRVFGVPGILVQSRLAIEHNGSLGGGNYAQARRSLWDETLSPEITRIEGGITRGLRDEYPGSWEVRSDKRHIQALREDAGEQADRWGKIFAQGGCTLNEYRVATGQEAITGGDVFRFGTLLVAATEIQSGALSGLDLDWEKGIATLNEARASHGLPSLRGGDVRQVSVRAIEQTTDQLAGGDMLVKPSQFSLAITGPSIDALPIAMQKLFKPEDLIQPEPAQPPALPSPAQPSGGGQGPAGQEPAPFGQKRRERKAKALTATQREQLTAAIDSARSGNVEQATKSLQAFFKKLASRVAGTLGSKAAPGAPETKRDEKKLTAAELLGDDADLELARIIKRIAEQTAQDVWDALSDTGVFAPADFDLGNARVRDLLRAAADRVTEINETTRTAIQGVLDEGYAAGRPVRDLARGWTDAAGVEHAGIRDVIEESYKGRAETIARTEVMFAQHGAQLGRYGAAGLGKVEAQDGTDDPECAERNGQVYSLEEAAAIDDHPNGTLNWLPVFDGGEDAE